MDKIDPQYDVEIRVLIFYEYRRNKFIDVHIIYVLDEKYKYNII